MKTATRGNHALHIELASGELRSIAMPDLEAITGGGECIARGMRAGQTASAAFFDCVAGRMQEFLYPGRRMP